MELATTASLPATFTGLDADSMLSDFAAYIDATRQTVATYCKGIRAFIGYLREQGIERPGREHVLAWRDSLKADCKATTIATYLAGVRRFFGWTAMRGLWANIADGIKGVKLERKFKKDCLTAGQARDLLASVRRDSVQGLRDYALLSLMLTTGLRDVEVSRAYVEDMRISGGQLVLFIQGKGRSEKADYVKLSDPVEKAIREWLAARGKTDGKDPLFCSVSNHGAGAALTTRSISRIVKSRLAAIGIDSDRVTAHSLRHTAATLNLLAGGSLEETQQLLRHKSIVTTMIYSHALKRAANESENRISDAIFA